jgi:CRP/FNR family transcriptional regulator, dissimilatory nitrate respiration regulator
MRTAAANCRRGRQPGKEGLAMNLEQFSPLRQHRLLATLDEQQFARIAAASQSIELGAEQMLFQRGAAARHFYIVIAGQVRLCLQSRSGHEKIVELLGPGQAFAEALMFSESPAFPVTSIAVMPTTLAAIPNADYLGILRASTETCLRMLADLSWRLHSHMREIEALSFENARNRLVNHLMDLAGQGTGGISVTLAESKQALAARLAIKPETLSRTLRALTEEGSIEVDGRQIRILDRAKLRQPGAAD